MAHELVPGNADGFLIYQTEDGQARVQVRLEDETVWLTQKQMADLFQKDVRTVSEHIRNLFAEGELRQDSVVRDFRITAADGKRYATQHYNLDVGVAKNYLTEDELRALNLIVAAYLDFAELQAVTRKPMAMHDWIAKLDDFIRISDRQILTHAGTISHDTALQKAKAELARFRAAQDVLPQPVDEHFAAAVDEVKRLEAGMRERTASWKKSKKWKSTHRLKPKADGE